MIPDISIVIPVLGEEKRINTIIDHLNDINNDSLIEIIVVDGDQEGSTIREINSNEIMKLISEKGRGKQMNCGAKCVSGKIVLFVHSDTFLPIDAYDKIITSMINEELVGGSFSLGIHSNKKIYSVIAYCASLKHRITRVPYGDQSLFFRNTFFKEIEGYKEMPLFEDVEIMKRIKRLKRRIVILPEKTMTSPRKWQNDGVMFAVLRNLCLQILYFFGASPEFLARIYYK